MDFITHLFWNHLPYVESEIRIINGKEEVCLIIPTKTNQLKKGRNGNWLSTFRMIAVPPNEQMITHDMQLGYLNYDEVAKARAMGVYKKTQYIGRVREHDRTPSKKINRANDRATNIFVDGAICIDDCPDDLIVTSRDTGKRYIKCTFRRNGPNGTPIFTTGAVCLDDIPDVCIKQNPRTGKRNVLCRFRRSKYMDTYFNTHELICTLSDGSEIEIGRFHEWTKATATQKRIARFEADDTEDPDTIDGQPTTPTKDDNIIIDGLNL